MDIDRIRPIRETRRTEAPIPHRTVPPDLDVLAHGFADEGHVRAVQRAYLVHFRHARKVADLGCGRGVFLDLLREAGIAAVGVEQSEAVARGPRERGHEVAAGDAAAWLRDREEPFDGVFCGHVVEHLGPEAVAALFAAVAGALAPGGVAVFVTPNPRNHLVMSEVFWLDPTHLRPWPRALLERLGASVGLAVAESYDDPATAPRRPPLRRLLARLRSALTGVDRSGPMDSVVVFRKP